jgi:hypothetical protein
MFKLNISHRALKLLLLLIALTTTLSVAILAAATYKAVNQQLKLEYRPVANIDNVQIRQAHLGNWPNADNYQYIDAFWAARKQFYKQSIMPRAFNRDCIITPLGNVHPAMATNYECIFADTQTNFRIMIDGQPQMGNVRVLSNDQLLWRQKTDGGSTDGIGNIKLWNGKLYLAYTTMYTKGNTFLGNKSIIELDGAKVTNLGTENSNGRQVFTPLVLKNNLLFFTEQNQQTSIVLNHQVLDVVFDEVLIKTCCEVAVLNIHQQDNTLDFFARRGDNWYHVIVEAK